MTMNTEQYVKEIQKSAAAVERDAWTGKMLRVAHVARFYGTSKPASGKAWTTDQMLRILLGDGYAAFRETCGEWDEGINPLENPTST